MGIGIRSCKIGASSYIMYYKFDKGKTNMLSKVANKISTNVKRKGEQRKW